jgi:N-acetylneuraminic acid mutarotase
VFAGVAAAIAQAPVITNLGDVRTLSVNTAFNPGDPDPAWKSMAPMPTARVAFATAAVNGRVYAIGGAVLGDCVTVSTVEAYDPAGDYWITGLPDMPPPLRFRPAGAALGDVLYVVGGGGDTPEEGCSNVALGTVQAFDPATSEWSTRSSLNTPRLQVGLGVDSVNHLLYAVGGATAPDKEPLATVEVYDPVTDKWEYKHDLNTPRGAPAVAVVNGKVYAIGGENARGVEEFDPATNTWTTKPSRMPHPRHQSAAVVVDDKIYVMGGRDDSGIISTVDVYDPSFDTWTTVASLPTTRLLLGAAVVDNTIYAVGGAALVARVGVPFIYQITATNNPTSYDASSLPDGLSIDRERGIVSGIPTAFTQGFVVTFTATNASGSDSKDVSLYIAQYKPSEPPLQSIVSSTCVTGRAGQPFAFQVLTNNAGPDAKLAATGLPYSAGIGPQMTIDPGTGLISGMATSMSDGSSQSFGVGLNLSNEDAAQSFLQLTFVSDPSFPVITSGSNTALIPNSFFSYTITADAPTTSLDYLGLDGTLNGLLPAGLSYDRATGTISGLYTGDVQPGTLARSARAEHRVNGDSRAEWTEGIRTIKKEPPPRIQLFALEEENGTGTAPLNFFVGLHDLEVEALKAKQSEGTEYVIFTDDLLTSGGAGLLKSTKVGDYVSYTVPIQASGTYDVKVGIRTSANQGTFQLAIDGTNQGPLQDEYSPTVGYEVRDLGPVTFTDNEKKIFKFLITGKNPNSSGYEFVCDYLDLVPYFEAEDLPVEARSAPHVIINDPHLSGGAATLLKATGVGDYVTYGVTIAKAGIYNVRVKTKTGSNTGIFQLFIDGVRQGYAQRQGTDISGNGYYSVRDLGTVKFTNPGQKDFQFLVTGRNRGGTKYHLVFDYLELILTSHREAEELSADSTTELDLVTDANLSGEAGILLKAGSPGEFVAYKVTIPSSGTYNVKAGIRKGIQNGIVQLAIDGVNQGSVRDNYSAEVDYEVVDLGRITVTEACEKTFQFLVTGHNPNSTGYQFVLDYIDLVR